MRTYLPILRPCILASLLIGGLPPVLPRAANGQSVEIDEFPETVQQLLLDLHPYPSIVTTEPDLPPLDGVYRTLGSVWGWYEDQGSVLVLTAMRRRVLTGQRPSTYDENEDEVQNYSASMVGTLLVSAGELVAAPFPVELTGPVETRAYGKAGHTTGTFDTEIVSMSLTGTVPLPGSGTVSLQVRESPTLASLGQTSINDLGDGTYNVDSFFDVFTELSVDGGESWTAAVAPGSEDLAPPPELAVMVGASTWNVHFENEIGQAIDHNSNGLEEVQAQIVSMELKGNTSRGPIQETLRGVDQPHATWGEIEEQVNNTDGILDVDPFQHGDADSFFDIWPQITLTGTPLVTGSPLPVDTVISNKPPQDGERFTTPYVLEEPLIYPGTGSVSGLTVLHKIYQPSPTIEFDHFQKTMATVELQGGPLGTAPVSFVMSGPSLVHVYFEGASEGDALDDDMDGLDEVPAQLVSMPLSNGTMRLDLRSPSKSPFAPSVGFIEEQVNSTPGRLDLPPFGSGVADSFFDVYFQLTVPSFGVLHNEAAVRMESEIEEKPPFDCYRYLAPAEGGPWLYDEDGNFTGIRVVSATHCTTVIEIDEFDKTVQQLLIQAGASSGIETDDPTFPPMEGVLSHAGETYGAYRGAAATYNLTGIRQRILSDPLIETVNDDELATFESGMSGTLVPLDGDLAGQKLPMQLTGPVQTLARLKALSATGTFDTEIVSMSLSGSASLPGGESLPLALREAPSLASSGQTTISDLGGGLYHIDSFFDVFTELSVDGGNSWMPITEPVRMIRVPPPELVPLVGASSVLVFFEGGNEGDADDENDNGLDEVATEIVSLDLRGYSSWGVITETGRTDLPTRGEIEEQVNNTPGTLDVDPFAPGSADSFFDVWPEITLAGNRLHTFVTLPLSTVINHKPPQNGERYVTVASPEAELVDAASGTPSGIVIVGKTHQPDPTTEHDLYPGSDGVITLSGGPFSVPQPFALSGAAAVDVFFEGADEGDALDDDYDGADEVVAQLVSLNLTSDGVTLRVRSITSSPFAPTLGFLTEEANHTPGTLDVAPFATGNVDSFFDVFCELELPDGTVLHNEEPLRVSGTFSEKPFPSGECFGGGGPVALLDENNDPTGISLTIDHICLAPSLDFGDANDSPVAPLYPTLLPLGARHAIVSGGPILGQTIDSESDGQPTTGADGDDTDADGDDEDGANMPSLWYWGSNTQVDVYVDAPTGAAYLNMWVDWNGDRDWTDAGENVLNDAVVATGSHTFTVQVPFGAVLGTTYVRFRIYSQAGLAPGGEAMDGEVEDYAIQIAAPVVDHKMHWPQWPDPQGWDVKATDPHILADDFMCTEGGPVNHITFWGSWLGDQTGTIQNIHLSIHTDDRKSQSYSMPGELLWQWDTADFKVTEELSELQGWYDPVQRIVQPNDHSRYFRYNVFIPEEEAFTQEVQTIYWLDIKVTTLNGEWGWKTSQSEQYEDDAVWWMDAQYPWQELTNPTNEQESLDLAFVINELNDWGGTDYGDAPEPPYATTVGNNGPSHVIVKGFFLGAGVDGEPDGQPLSGAVGDDADVAPANPFPNWNDEDGIAFSSLLVAGQSVPVNIIVATGGRSAVLNGWVDFNANGSWLDPGEHVIADMAVVAGLNSTNIVVPVLPTLGASYARFRLTPGTGVSPDGPESAGEVEDYQLLLYQSGPDSRISITNLTVETGGSNAVVFWTSEAGVIYSLQETPELMTPAWSNVGPPVVGPTNNQTDAVTSSSGTFYRVIAPWIP